MYFLNPTGEHNRQSNHDWHCVSARALSASGLVPYALSAYLAFRFRAPS